MGSSIAKSALQSGENVLSVKKLNKLQKRVPNHTKIKYFVK